MDRPVVIVSGASRGLGAAAAGISAGLGADVVLTARSLDDLHQTAGKIEVAGGSALVVQGDLSREEDIQAVVRRTIEQFGRVDALVNNGGIIDPIAPIAAANVAEWQANWAVNVLGAVMLTRYALPYLREAHGRVVNITSGTAEYPVGGWGAYSMAKAAINQFTRVLAKEEPDISALALRPGQVDTNMQAEIRRRGKGRMTEENYRFLKDSYERGQLLPPDAPGRAIACLSLAAPHEWSGEILKWDDERIRSLVREIGGQSGTPSTGLPDG